jgi:hypothetical protein
MSSSSPKSQRGMILNQDQEHDQQPQEPPEPEQQEQQQHQPAQQEQQQQEPQQSAQQEQQQQGLQQAGQVDSEATHTAVMVEVLGQLRMWSPWTSHWLGPGPQGGFLGREEAQQLVCWLTKSQRFLQMWSLEGMFHWTLILR